MVARYGGVGGLISSVKIPKTLTGLCGLKCLPPSGRLSPPPHTFSCAAFPDERGSTAAFVTLLSSILNGFSVFLLRQQTTFMIIWGDVLLLGTVPEHLRKIAIKSVLRRVLLAVLIVNLMLAGWHVARDCISSR